MPDVTVNKGPAMGKTETVTSRVADTPAVAATVKPGDTVNLWRIGNGLVAVSHPAKVKKVDEDEVTVDCMKSIVDSVSPFTRSGKPIVGRDEFPCYTRVRPSDS